MAANRSLLAPPISSKTLHSKSSRSVQSFPISISALRFSNSRNSSPLPTCMAYFSDAESSKKQQSSSRLGKTRSNAKDESLICTSHITQKDENPPLVSALKSSAEQNAASFHFPGHNRGNAAPSSLAQLIGLKPFIHDLPELPELDNLFSPEGPILEAQRLAAELFGSLETWFLVGGTTCGIQAAIMATCSPGQHIILPRNSHVSAISGLVLSGAIPKYIMPEYDSAWDIAGKVTPSLVEKAIFELKIGGDKPAAVFITSPTYHGVCSDLTGICQLCHSHGIPVIVDEAHGAHFEFHPQFPLPALKQGADLVVQSTHKVLCSLTSSMLHMSGNMVDRERICWCLQTLQSTSPSYLLLASLDAARAQLAENPKTVFNKAVDLAVEAKCVIQKIAGIALLHQHTIDPLRFTVGFWQLGISGFEADDYLYKSHGIVSELVGTRYITFAINLGTREEHVHRLITGLKELSACATHVESIKATESDGRVVPFGDIRMRLNPRDAFFAKKRRVSVRESLGKVCGELICPYPPGIPIMFPGEIVTQSALDYLVEARHTGADITGASDPSLASIVICDA